MVTMSLSGRILRLLRTRFCTISHIKTTWMKDLKQNKICTWFLLWAKCLPSPSGPHSYVEDLIFNMMALGGGAFVRWSGLEEVIRVEALRVCDVISFLIRRGSDQTPLSFCCEFRARSQSPVYRLVRGLTRHLPALGSWTSQPPGPWEINVCCLRHPVFSILL